MKFYFAYGSNLWREQMQQRCPEQIELGSAVLKGYRWIITARGYANVVTSPPDIVHGKIYRLSTADEESLDRYERVADGAYRKEVLMVERSDGQRCACLVYIDSVEEEGEPLSEYVERLKKGIADAQLPAEYAERYLRKVFHVCK